MRHELAARLQRRCWRESAGGDAGAFEAAGALEAAEPGLCWGWMDVASSFPAHVLCRHGPMPARPYAAVPALERDIYSFTFALARGAAGGRALTLLQRIILYAL